MGTLHFSDENQAIHRNRWWLIGSLAIVGAIGLIIDRRTKPPAPAPAKADDTPAQNEEPSPYAAEDASVFEFCLRPRYWGQLLLVAALISFLILRAWQSL
jgi:hypothetical protein